MIEHFTKIKSSGLNCGIFVNKNIAHKEETKLLSNNEKLKITNMLLGQIHLCRFSFKLYQKISSFFKYLNAINKKSNGIYKIRNRNSCR